jgi:hypothetical protein
LILNLNNVLLLEELGPEVRQSEDLLEEDVVLRAGLGPLIELIHQLDMAGEVVNGLHLLLMKILD